MCDIQADMMRLTLAVACRTLFGAEACPEPDTVGKTLQAAMESLVQRRRVRFPLPGWVPTRVNLRFKRRCAI